MMYENTSSVQAFVRGIAFVISTLLFGLLVVFPLSILSASIFGEPMVLVAPAVILTIVVSSIISKMFFILPAWEQIVILRLGKFHEVKGAGFFVIPPFIYSVAAIVDMRIITQQVEATATLTKDNVPTKVTAAVEYRVEDCEKAVIHVQNYRSSVIWLSTEALKNTIGSLDLKELLSERDQIADQLRLQIDQGAATYGVDIRAVRITDIDTPAELVEELAVIARSRRGAEAKKIQAEAEIMVAEKIAEAGRILGTSGNALRLRELQILSEMSKDQGSMVIIYPYGERSGQEIANGMASITKKS